IQFPVGRVMAEYERAAIVAQGQLASDVAEVESYNNAVRVTNGLIAQALKDILGEDRGETREGWDEWWTNIEGYAYNPSPEPPVPTIVQSVPLAYQPQPVPVSTQTRSSVIGSVAQVSPASSVMSCFGAGTAVRTLRGSAPIETLRVGDQVLTQELK